MVPQRLRINNGDKTKTKYSDVKPLSMKKRNIIYVAVLLVVTVSAFGLFICPAVAKTQKLRLKLERAEAELDEKLKLENGLQGLIKKYRNDLRLAEGLVFTDTDIATFLENFSDFARQANMTPISIVSMSVKPVPVSSESEKALMDMSKDKKEDKPKKDMADKLPGLLMKPMEIKIKGEYPDLVNFLISLEEYKQLLTINNLNICIAREGYPFLEAGFIIYLYKMESPETSENEEV